MRPTAIAIAILALLTDCAGKHPPLVNVTVISVEEQAPEREEATVRRPPPRPQRR